MTLPGGSAVAAAALSQQIGANNLKRDFELLPLVLDILDSIDKGKDQREDLTRKVANFKARIQLCKESLNNLTGLETSLVEQEHVLSTLQEEFQQKKDLIEKFEHLQVITSSMVKKEP